MYIHYALCGLLVAAWAAPTPPTVFNPDGSKMGDDAPTVFNPDGTPASSSDSKTNMSQSGPIIDTPDPTRWTGPAEKYFHEAYVRRSSPSISTT